MSRSAAGHGALQAHVRAEILLDADSDEHKSLEQVCPRPDSALHRMAKTFGNVVHLAILHAIYQHLLVFLWCQMDDTGQGERKLQAPPSKP